MPAISVMSFFLIPKTTGLLSRLSMKVNLPDQLLTMAVIKFASGPSDQSSLASLPTCGISMPEQEVIFYRIVGDPFKVVFL
jgi:hypothetical protein